MKITEIVKILSAKVLCGEEFLDRVVTSACGSDMMSDVLAYVHDQSMLISGLTNAQVVRTAEMMDMFVIVFVRGKEPEPSVIALAKSKDIILLSTSERMFTACGLLYTNGLNGNI